MIHNAMAKERQETATTGAGPASRRVAEAAQRALAEAEARRARSDRAATVPPKELGGRTGPDPVRYGDWENKGIASDF